MKKSGCQKDVAISCEPTTVKRSLPRFNRTLCYFQEYVIQGWPRKLDELY